MVGRLAGGLVGKLASRLAGVILPVKLRIREARLIYRA